MGSLSVYKVRNLFSCLLMIRLGLTRVYITCPNKKEASNFGTSRDIWMIFGA